MPNWLRYEGFYGNLSYRVSKMLPIAEARVVEEGRKEGRKEVVYPFSEISS